MPEYQLVHDGRMYTVELPGVIPVKVDRVYRAIRTKIAAGQKRGSITITSTDGEKFKAEWYPQMSKREKAAAKVEATKRPTRAKPKLQRQKRRHV